VVYLRGTGAADRDFTLLEQAAAARGWVVCRDFTSAWHLARSGFVRVVRCDISPATGLGLYSHHVLVEQVRARHNPTSHTEHHELLPVHPPRGGRHPRPERFDRDRLNSLQRPGAIVLDTDAVIGLIAAVLAPTTVTPT
jgi:hypothetical protein